MRAELITYKQKTAAKNEKVSAFSSSFSWCEVGGYDEGIETRNATIAKVTKVESVEGKS